MEALGGYGSDSDGSSSAAPLPVHTSTIVRMSAAPQPSIYVQSRRATSTGSSALASSNALALIGNPGSELDSGQSNRELYASKRAHASLGPSAPSSSTYYKQTNWSEGEVGFSGVKVTRGDFDEAAFRQGYDGHNAERRDAAGTVEGMKEARQRSQQSPYLPNR